MKEFIIKHDMLIKYLGENLQVEIPPQVKTIAKGAFSNSDVKQIILSKETAKIESLAFDLSSIMQIYIPNSSIEIESEAFYKCDMLEDISFTQYAKNNATINNGAFVDCPKINNETKNKIISINKYAIK